LPKIHSLKGSAQHPPEVFPGPKPAQRLVPSTVQSSSETEHSEKPDGRNFLLTPASFVVKIVKSSFASRLSLSMSSPMIRSLAFSLFGVLILCGTSNADFVFSLAPGAINAEIGGAPVPIDLLVENDSTSAATLEGFSVTVAQDSGGAQFDPISDVFNYNGAPINFAAGQTLPFENLFSFSAKNSATVGQVAVYNLSGGYNDGSNPLPTFLVSGALTVTAVTAVPEPTGLLILGSAAVWGTMRRRRRSS
jgi:hypothetical protein